MAPQRATRSAPEAVTPLERRGPNGRGHLSKQQKAKAVAIFLHGSNNGTPWSARALARQLNVNAKSLISWANAVKTSPSEDVAFERKKSSNAGKPRFYEERVVNFIKQYIATRKGVVTQAQIVDAVMAKFDGGSAGGINKLLHNGEFKLRHYRLKPRLTVDHMRRRLEFALQYQGIDVTSPILIHVDEKWWLAAEKVSLILLKDDDTPVKPVQSKRYVKKLMALVAVGPPIYGSNGEELASGKVAFVPCSKATTAKRTTKNHKRGDIVYEAVNVDAETYVNMMVDDVFPAARKMYPNAPEIIIQQDNAPGHAAAGVVERLEAAAASAADVAEAETGIRPPPIKIRNQPAQSPDMNVLDLCVFTIINNAYKRERARGHLRRMAELREQQKEDAAIAPRTLLSDLDAVADLATDDAASDPADAAADPAAGDAAAAGAPPPDRRNRTVASQKGVMREGGAAQQCLDRSKGNRCTYCNGNLPNDESECVDSVVSCAWRGGRFHIGCCAVGGQFTDVLENGTALFVCHDCEQTSCNRRRDETRATCILCRSNDLCTECVKAKRTECDHMAFCAISEGKFHDECLAAWDVTPEDSADGMWCCPMCVLNDKAEELLGAGIDWGKVNADGDDTMALMKATRAAFDQLDPLKVKHAFELFNTVLGKVIECKGGNQYKLHTGARKRRREAASQAMPTQRRVSPRQNTTWTVPAGT